MKPWTTADLIARNIKLPAVIHQSPPCQDAAPVRRMNLERSAINSANRAEGKRAQSLVLSTLRLHGIKVEGLETGWRVRREFKDGKSDIVGATPIEKVLSDIVGVLPAGRALLIEVKAHNEERLSFSCFKPHQPGNLTKWADQGACVGVAWVRGLDIALIPWPVSPADWSKGHPLDWGVAQQLDVMPMLTGRTRVPSPR